MLLIAVRSLLVVPQPIQDRSFCAPRGSREALRAIPWYFRRIPEESRVSCCAGRQEFLVKQPMDPPSELLLLNQVLPGYWLTIWKQLLWRALCKSLKTNITGKTTTTVWLYGYFILITDTLAFQTQGKQYLYTAPGINFAESTEFRWSAPQFSTDAGQSNGSS